MWPHDSLPGFSFPVRLTSVQPGLAHWKKIPKTMLVKAALVLNGAAPCPTFRREREGSGCVRKKGARARVCVWSTLAFKVHSGGESGNGSTGATPETDPTFGFSIQSTTKLAKCWFHFLFFLSRWWISFSCCNAARKSAHPNTVKLNTFCFLPFLKKKQKTKIQI